MESNTKQNAFFCKRLSIVKTRRSQFCINSVALRDVFSSPKYRRHTDPNGGYDQIK